MFLFLSKVTFYYFLSVAPDLQMFGTRFYIA